MICFHYTRRPRLCGILRELALLPSPTLAVYGLAREAVEANPGLHGFQSGTRFGKRCFRKWGLSRPDEPPETSAAVWFAGERFVSSFSLAPWCGAALGFLPEEALGRGYAYRLVVDLAGLDAFGWPQFQARTGVPGPWRRAIGELAREKGDDPATQWLFVAGAVPLGGRLLEVEQYHTGRWRPLAEVFARAPLAELHAEGRGKRLPPRHEFHATFAQLGRDKVAPHAVTSLFVRVALADGRFVADHVWVRQSWGHLRGGDRVAFFAEVAAYPKGRSEAGYTLANVNGLRVLARPGPEKSAAGA
jgi:hypothetical protein